MNPSITLPPAFLDRIRGYRRRRAPLALLRRIRSKWGALFFQNRRLKRVDLVHFVRLAFRRRKVRNIRCRDRRHGNYRERRKHRRPAGRPSLPTELPALMECDHPDRSAPRNRSRHRHSTNNHQRQHSPHLGKILPEIPSVGNRKLTEGDRFFADTLLRRGFPVRFEERGLALCPGGMREDAEYLERALKGFRRAALRMQEREIGGNDGSGDCGELLPFYYGEQHGPERMCLIPTSHHGMLQQFRNRMVPEPKTVSWMTGSPIPGSMYDSYDKFVRCKFGARIPVEAIESGVALLVKTLPWLSVLTSMSCHGHLRGEHARRGDGESTPPRLWFYSHYHSRWCEMLFNRLFQDLPIRETWVFHHGPEEGGWMSATWEASQSPPESRQEQQYLFVQIQLMARRLFDPELCERLRNVKRRATDMGDLERRLDSVL